LNNSVDLNDKIETKSETIVTRIPRLNYSDTKEVRRKSRLEVGLLKQSLINADANRN